MAKTLLKILAKAEADSLSLDGLTPIDEGVAQELVKSIGCRWLTLSGLTSVDRDVARELAKFDGDSLSLSALTTITPEVLKKLRANLDTQLPSEFDEKP